MHEEPARRRPGLEWAIGRYVGPSPFALRPDRGEPGPVLTAADVTDVDAAFVADPFLLRRAGRWYLFFEILPAGSRRGVIGLATSDDARRWSYRGVVLEEPFHLSYPHVFRFEGDVFMTPEAYWRGRVVLYQADPFPSRWRRVAEPVAGCGTDPTPFRHAGRWWMFVGMPAAGNATLRLYHADRLVGPWREHRESPVVRGDPRRARPAGRVFAWNGRRFRVAQDCATHYGGAVRAFEIMELTVDRYVERPATPELILSAGDLPWNSGRVHHVDAHPADDGTWFACVDGTGPLP